MKHKLLVNLYTQIRIISKDSITVKVKAITVYSFIPYFPYKECSYSSVIEQLFLMYPGSF